METTTVMWIVGGGVAVIDGLVLHIFRQRSKFDDATRKMIEEHIRQCNETPNKAILQSITSLAENFNSKHSENRTANLGLVADIALMRKEVSDQAGDIKVLKDRSDSRRADFGKD